MAKIQMEAFIKEMTELVDKYVEEPYRMQLKSEIGLAALRL